MLSTYSITADHTLPTSNANCLDHFMGKLDNNKTSAYIAVLNTSIKTTIPYFWPSRITTVQGPNKLVPKLWLWQGCKNLQDKHIETLLFSNDPDFVLEHLTRKLNKSLEDIKIVNQFPKEVEAMDDLWYLSCDALKTVIN